MEGGGIAKRSPAKPTTCSGQESQQRQSLREVHPASLSLGRCESRRPACLQMRQLAHRLVPGWWA